MRFDFRKIRRSLVLPGKNQRKHAYSTRADYVHYFMNHQLAKDDADFAAKNEFVLGVHEHWHSRAQQGCRFASFLSTRMPRSGWQRAVVSWRRLVEDTDQVADLRATVAAAIADPDCHALSLLFPEIVAETQLVDLIRFLNCELGWLLEVVPEPADQWHAPEPIVTLAFRIPLTSRVAAWPLGFGPFEFLPLTRRGPLVEIAFVTKPRMYPVRSMRIKDNPSAAHLADIPIDVSDPTFDRLWVRTEDQKELVLGDQIGAPAKARVTFAVPTRLWSVAS